MLFFYIYRKVNLAEGLATKHVHNCGSDGQINHTLKPAQLTANQLISKQNNGLFQHKVLFQDHVSEAYMETDSTKLERLKYIFLLFLFTVQFG